MSIRFVATAPAPVADITLPSPSINSSGASIPNQTLQRSASGAVFTFQHGPERYNHDLTFIALTEEENASVFSFLQAIGWAAFEIEYEFTDPRDNTLKTLPCRIIGAPSRNRISINNNDISIRLELPVPFDYENASP